jgi:4-carboxymuconolactone decarboxylase
MTTRVPAIRSKDDLDPRHHAIYDSIVKSRGNLRGVFTVLLYDPELAIRASELGDYVRYRSRLDGKVAELAVLVVARELEQPSIWSAHVNYAREAGVREEAIQTIKHRRDLSGLTAEEELVIGATQQLLRSKRIEDARFEQLLDRYGLEIVVDLTGTIGYFAMMACIQNAFGFEAWPDGDHLPISAS